MTEAPTSAEIARFGLDDWLEHIQRQHWRTIELQLDRVAEVWKRLGSPRPAIVVTVAGTNGKGSCVAMLEVVLRRAGYRTGSYTSPHLVRYNERVGVDGEPVGDQILVSAFQAIESVREEIPLTYFEYGTLCALQVFAESGVEACILETGMGGRLDAVNIIDSDIALITSIGLDHEQWLGGDRETIGREKAGVFRAGRPAICADPNPPSSIAAVAASTGTELLQSGPDYSMEIGANQSWSFSSSSQLVADSWRKIDGLSVPFPGAHQVGNLGCVVAALGCLAERWRIDPDCLDALATARIAGRCEVVAEAPLVIIDVAHNADSARYLGEMLKSLPVSGTRYAVLGVLADKDLGPILDSVMDEVDIWFLVTLTGERGQSAEALEQRLLALIPNARTETFDGALSGYRAALDRASPDDRIVAFGSFYTVGDILADW